METQLPEHNSSSTSPSSINTIIGFVKTNSKFVIPAAIIFTILLIFGIGFIFYKTIPLPLLTKQTASSPQPTSTANLIVYAPTLTPPQDKSLKQIIYSCPTTPSFCQGEENYKEGYLSGNVSDGSQITAVFDGEVSALESFHPKEDGSDEKFLQIMLTN